MVESHEAMYQAAVNLSRAAQGWVGDLGVAGSVVQGIRDACQQLDPQQYQPGTLQALRDFSSIIEECNEKVGAEGAEMAGLEATIAALYKLLGRVQKRHERCKGAAEMQALRMHNTLDQCINTIVQNEDLRALTFIAQFQEGIAGARAYSDMIASREVRISDPLRMGAGGLTITGAVPWEDIPQEYGFRQGMIGVESCIAELSRGKHDAGDVSTTPMLYHQNSIHQVEGEGPNTQVGDLTVPGFPSMAPKGTGDDKALAHKKAIQNMLGAAEERIGQAVATRAAQAAAQSSTPSLKARAPTHTEPPGA